MNAMIENVAIELIKPNANNPRFIRDDKYQKLIVSIRNFPEMLRLRPIIVNAEMVILGGNMRFRACVEAGMRTIPVIIAKNLTPGQQAEFIIKDNVGFGEWDWDVLANEWEPQQLEEWGLELPGFDLSVDGLGEEFRLPEGDKKPFQQITFTLADEQAEFIKLCLSEIDCTEEEFGNTNKNGNALYKIFLEWDGQRK
jgi:hypothetical protein